MELSQSILQRRSYREFESTPVERIKIEQMIMAAQKAPVSCNLQLTQYIIIDETTILQDLGRRVSSKFIYAPTVIVVLFDSRFTVERSSAVTALGMAVENMLLTATELGLGTCVMAGFGRDEIIKEKLAIPSEVEIGLIIAVGYPKLGVYKSEVAKVPVAQTFSYNTYNDLPRLNDSNSLSDHNPASIREYRSRIGSVYLDRLRLNTWSDTQYQQVASSFVLLMKDFLSEQSVILDVMTYDAKFISLISQNIVGRLIASDYVDQHLTVYRQLFNCQTALIDSQNHLKTLADRSVDLVTCVYQSSFTPAFDDLLLEIYRVLKPGGKLFLVHGKESWFKYARRQIFQNIVSLLSSRHVNIYERNPYFRIGPYSHKSLLTIQKKLKKAGFRNHLSNKFSGSGLQSFILLCDVVSDAEEPKTSLS